MDLKFSFNPKTRQSVVECEQLQLIREVLSVKNEAAAFAHKRGLWHIPDRKYCITPTGRFELGMYSEIIRAAKSLGTSINVMHDANIQAALNPQITHQGICELELPLRDYQEEVVEKCLSTGWGTVILATAGGKTLVMASLVSTYLKYNPGKRVLILVPDIGLTTQTHGDFVSYGIDEKILTRWTGKLEPDKGANIIIANLGILQSEKQDPTWLYDVDMFLCDETHKLRADNKVNDIIRKIKTPNRFGFTGTMPEEKLDYWNVLGKMGPVIYEKNSESLRRENYITQVDVSIIRIDYSEGPDYSNCTREPTSRFLAEQEFLIRNEFRNRVISKLGCGLKNNTLIMVDRIEHGLTLETELKKHIAENNLNRKIYWICGEVEVQDREALRAHMEKSNDVVCIAISKIFSTGVNIKNIHNIIFAGGGKAKVKIVQSIGRGLRKHETKDRLTIVDIGDNLKYSNSHLEKRMRLYDNETIPYTIKDIKQ